MNVLSSEQEAKLVMEAQVEELKAELASLQEEVAAKEMQLNQVEDELLQVKAKAEVDSEEWQQKVSEVRIEAELVRLRDLERLREEHSVALRREQTFVDLERERVKEHVAALTASFAVEKSELEKTVQELSSEVRKLTSKCVSFSESVESTGGDSTDTDICVTTPASILMAVESSSTLPSRGISVGGDVSPSSSGMVTSGDSVPTDSAWGGDRPHNVSGNND
jgi:predicted RNase H-like nuclease (RuvC/YqgF family)